MLHRPAIWLLLAATSLPATPLLAQDATIGQPPPTDVVVPPPPVTQPVVTQPAPTPIQTAPPPSATRPTPVTEAPAAPARTTTTRTSRTTTTRAAPTARASAPARQSPPARTAVPAATAATAAPAAAPAAAPVAAQPAATAPAAPTPFPVPPEPASNGSPVGLWTWLILGGLLLLGAFAFLQMRRHRRRVREDEVFYDEAPVMAEPVYESSLATAPMIAPAEPAIADEVAQRREYDARVDTVLASAALHESAAQAAEEPVAVAEDVSVADADPADVEALAAGSAAPDGRPWLEFLMRPVRAGTSKDSTVVEFELTVGNTGTATARDVRISTFMFAAGAAGESEMERMLIDPPADAALAGVEIEAGDATKVEAQMALPREGVTEGSVLPVVVADARYRLPDGSEGRTRASFAVGIPSEGGLDPFPTDRTSGLLESVDARLHDEPERV